LINQRVLFRELLAFGSDCDHLRLITAMEPALTGGITYLVLVLLQAREHAAMEPLVMGGVARHSSWRRCDTHFEHGWDRNYRLDGDSSVNMMASALPGDSHQAMALIVTDGEHPTGVLTVRSCRSPITSGWA
jgi:hypothetical protein